MKPNSVAIYSIFMKYFSNSFFKKLPQYMFHNTFSKLSVYKLVIQLQIFYLCTRIRVQQIKI